MSPHQPKSVRRPPATASRGTQASTVVLLRTARVVPPVGKSLDLLRRWRQLLEQAPGAGVAALVQDLDDLTTLLHAGPVEEIGFQPELVALADELTRLARATVSSGALPDPR